LLYPNRTRLAQRSRKRFIQKSKEYERLLQAGEWSQKDYQRHVEPPTAFTLYADAKALRKRQFHLAE